MNNVEKAEIALGIKYKCKICGEISDAKTVILSICRTNSICSVCCEDTPCEVCNEYRKYSDD